LNGWSKGQKGQGQGYKKGIRNKISGGDKASVMIGGDAMPRETNSKCEKKPKKKGFPKQVGSWRQLCIKIGRIAKGKPAGQGSGSRKGKSRKIRAREKRKKRGVGGNLVHGFAERFIGTL